MPANTISEVIEQLELLITNSMATNNRIGYFAALYHKVTVRVAEGIRNNEFEDGKRMELLDVCFANRFLDAVAAHQNKQMPTAPWQAAFDAAGKSMVVVLQHLLLGMNAHINLDLGIAAAATVGDGDLQALQKDFNAINTILGSLTGDVMGSLNRVSPLLSLIGLHARNQESMFIQFSLTNARDGAWKFAQDLHAAKKEDRPGMIAGREAAIGKLATAINSKGMLLRFTVFIIWLFEWKKPRKIIGVMYNAKKRYYSAGAA